MEFVGLYRHPMAVARSLGARESMPIPIEHGLALWKFYNLRLPQHYDKKPFPILCFDWPEAVFIEKLADVISSLGLQVHGAESQFYSAEIHVQRADDDDALDDETAAMPSRLSGISC